jgi:hypothetical protein
MAAPAAQLAVSTLPQSGAEQDEEDREFTRRVRNIYLRERGFRLFRQKVLLALTVALAVGAFIVAALGGHVEVSLIAGGSGITTGVGAFIEGRRGRSESEGHRPEPG